MDTDEIEEIDSSEEVEEDEELEEETDEEEEEIDSTTDSSEEIVEEVTAIRGKIDERPKHMLGYTIIGLSSLGLVALFVYNRKKKRY